MRISSFSVLLLALLVAGCASASARSSKAGRAPSGWWAYPPLSSVQYSPAEPGRYAAAQLPASRGRRHTPLTVTSAPPKILTARVIEPPSGETNLPRGTAVPAKEIGTPRDFRNTEDGFALGGPFGSTYPVITVNGGATWRIAGPVLCNANADAAVGVESVAVVGPRLDVAYGDTAIDVNGNGEGGKVWYQVVPEGEVVAVVAGFHGIAAYVQVTDAKNAVTGTIQYVSTDGGRRWTLSNALGG